MKVVLDLRPSGEANPVLRASGDSSWSEGDENRVVLPLQKLALTTDRFFSGSHAAP